MNSPRENGEAERNDEDQRPAGIEYHGVPGGSDDCQSAVVRLIQCSVRIARVRILTVRNEHTLLLCNEVGDQIAIKSGVTSGYGSMFRGAFANQFASDKFGEATTRWRKLEDCIQRGVGNPCPIVLIGLPAPS